jgi:hypothetical protein
MGTTTSQVHATPFPNIPEALFSLSCASQQNNFTKSDPGDAEGSFEESAAGVIQRPKVVEVIASEDFLYLVQGAVVPKHMVYVSTSPLKGRLLCAYYGLQ